MRFVRRGNESLTKRTQGFPESQARKGAGDWQKATAKPQKG